MNKIFGSYIFMRFVIRKVKVTSTKRVCVFKASNILC